MVSLQETPDGGKRSCEYLGHLFATKIAALLEDEDPRVAHMNRAKGRAPIAELEILGEHDPATTTHFEQPHFISFVRSEVVIMYLDDRPVRPDDACNDLATERAIEKADRKLRRL